MTTTEPPRSALATPGPAISTAGPTISAGGIHQTVATVPITTAQPAPLGAASSYGNGVSASIVKTAAITGVADRPGEIAGPAVAVTVQIINQSTEAIGLNNVIVNFYDSAGAPATRLSSAPSSPLSGALTAGTKQTGVYAFNVAKDHRAQVRITVSYAANAPIVLFTGTAPNG